MITLFWPRIIQRTGGRGIVGFDVVGKRSRLKYQRLIYDKTGDEEEEDKNEVDQKTVPLGEEKEKTEDKEKEEEEKGTKEEEGE